MDKIFLKCPSDHVIRAGLPDNQVGISKNILEDLYQNNSISPLLCVGIHCGKDRKNEYGTTDVLDYKGRGTKAEAYQQFIFDELLPFVRKTYLISSFKENQFADFL